MDEKSVNANSKINYAKPVLLDLGAVTTAYGAAFCEGGSTATIDCYPAGGTAGTDCMSGGTAYECTATGSTATVTNT